MVFVLADQSTSNSNINVETTKFFQFKHTQTTMSSKEFSVLQIYDISTAIRFQKLSGEKVTLQNVNATVSHEMRNPLNSIMAQNMKMQDLVKMMKNVLESNTKVSLQILTVQVTNFVSAVEESLQVQLSSTKLLNFCVNDMISLAQLNSDKFRKEMCNFDIREAVNEVMSIQKEKVSYLGIQLKASFVGFCENFIVCTDQYRLQQVLLNFQSNAVKFTPRNGKISIKCELFNNIKPYGMIKVSVLDNGIGIQKSDLSKLFKLFGFLDSSKEINSKGIGLGLFICKKIANTYGGDV